MSTRRQRAIAFAAMLLACSGATSANAGTIRAAAIDGGVTGSVTTGEGTPIANAVITLQGDGAMTTGRTDRTGHFTIEHVANGTYAIRVSAVGYDPLAPRTIDVRTAAITEVGLSLARSSSSLATIGRVVSGGGEALTTSSAPVATINPQLYAAEGYTRISDVLNDDMSTTLVHPAGGGSTILPTSVALRGPDPTETLVDIDGHQVNSGDTGDFDLSLLDPADYGNIELVKGISPSSLVGPDTIDGAINLRTLDPTVTPHGLLRLSAGSFNSFAETLENTGTAGRLGYAFSLHRTTTDGDVNGPIFDANTNAAANVGSGVDGATALGKLRYAFGASGGGYAEFSVHDQSVTRDLSAALSAYPSPAVSGPAGLPVVDGFEGSSLSAHNAGYGLDVRVPLGPGNAQGSEGASLLFRHYTSIVDQTVSGAALEASPYLYNDRDLIGENSLELDKPLGNGSLTLQYAVRNENLTITDGDNGGDINLESVARRSADALSFAPSPLDATTPATSAAPAADQTQLGQTQRSAVLRYIYDPVAQLHLTAAAYYSDYSIFGHEIDPRFGFVYTPDARTAARFSVGSTYQAPQLPELFVPSVLPAPVAGIITTGNPNLRPDHATEYDVGASHIVETGAHRTDVAVDVYRVNLRTPASTFVQAGQADTNCGSPANGGDGNPCLLSYAINAGDGVYQGIELSGERVLAPFVTLRAGYAVRSAYLTNVPPEIQDGTLVLYQQDAGLPLQKGTLSLTASPPRGFTYRAALVYEGEYNELNQPRFVTLAASLGYRWKAYEVVLSGTNLTNVYDQRFINTNGGIAYGLVAAPPQVTNSYALQGAALNLSFARRF